MTLFDFNGARRQGPPSAPDDPRPDILEIARRLGLNLKRQGAEHVSLCPFHQEKEPSFTISNERWHCFSCKAGGDVYELVRKVRGCSFPEAKAWAQDAPPPKRVRKPEPLPPTPEALEKRVSDAQALLDGPAKAYLHSRGITDDSIAHFRLGVEFDKAGIRWLTIPHLQDGHPVNIKRRTIIPPKHYRRVRGCPSVLFNADAVQAGKPVYLTEGEIDAITLHQAGYRAVGTTGGAGHFASSWAEQLAPASEIRIVYDGDEAGREGAEKVRTMLPGATVLPMPEGQDVNNYFLAGHTALPEPESAQPSLNRFTRALIQGDAIHDAFLRTLSQGWMIKGVLPESTTLAVIYGPPGTYKSFLAIDMGTSVATGTPWHEHDVKQCPVLYLAAEAGGGTLKRLKAWQVKRGKDSLQGFTLLPMPCLIDEQGELSLLLDAVRSFSTPPGLVFIDTLAKSMSGDENNTPDMNRVVRAAGEITARTGAMVVIVHHTGKDTTRGARGSIALEGGCDTMFRTHRRGPDDGRRVTLVCERQKDFEPCQDLTFNLELVETGFENLDGEEVVSLVPQWDPTAQSSQGEKPLKGANKKLWDALGEAIRLHGEYPREDVLARMDGYLPGDRVVHEDYWREIAYKMGVSDGTVDAKKKAFSRSKKQLEEMGKIGFWDGYYWKI